MKATDAVINAMIDVLRERTLYELKQEVATCLGFVGYLASTESSRFALPFYYTK